MEPRCGERAVAEMENEGQGTCGERGNVRRAAGEGATRCLRILTLITVP